MLVTLSGIVTLVRSLLPWRNVFSPILVISLPILIAIGFLKNTVPPENFIPAATKSAASILSFQPKDERSPFPKSNIVACMSERPISPPVKPCSWTHAYVA